MPEFVHHPRELFPGGSQIFTQAAYESLVAHFGGAFNAADSTAEEATFSLRAQRLFTGTEVIYDSRLRLPFSLREIETASGRVHVIKAIRKGLRLAFFGSEHLPYQLAQALAGLPPAARAHLAAALGTRSYRSAVHAFIRFEEERMFCLHTDEYVASYLTPRDARRMKAKECDVRIAKSPVTHNPLCALVLRPRISSPLGSDEYVADQVGLLRAEYMRRREGAKVVRVVDALPLPKRYVVVGKRPAPGVDSYDLYDAAKTPIRDDAENTRSCAY